MLFFPTIFQPNALKNRFAGNVLNKTEVKQTNSFMIIWSSLPKFRMHMNNRNSFMANPIVLA